MYKSAYCEMLSVKVKICKRDMAVRTYREAGMTRRKTHRAILTSKPFGCREIEALVMEDSGQQTTS